MSGDDGMPPIDLSIWRDAATQWGADPTPIGRELIDAVKLAIAGTARNLQREIGPSQIGTPCNRWLAHKFAGTEATGIALPKWAAAVGTAVHTHFSDWLHAYNERHGIVRFLTDLRVYVGDLYAGRPVFGTLDALDLATATIVDLKAPSKSQMDKYGPGRPENEVYDVQLDSYGVGCANHGFPVASVGILRLPRAGQLHDATWKARPHNPQRAQTALLRAGAIAKTVELMGPAAIPLQPTTEHFCGSCDYYLPGATDLTRACPGADSFLERGGPASGSTAASSPRRSSLASLIA